MTINKNFKRRVRARMAQTGETYTAALREIRIDDLARARRIESSPDGGIVVHSEQEERWVTEAQEAQAS